MIPKHVEKDFNEKVEDVVTLVQNRINVNRWPANVKVNKTPHRVQIKVVPQHPLGEQNADKYLLWIDKKSNDIRWCKGGY